MALATQTILTTTPPSLELARALAAEGIPLPPDCVRAEVLAHPDSVVTLRFEVYVLRDQEAAIARAITKVPAEAQDETY
jgi:hypothetical protein